MLNHKYLQDNLLPRIFKDSKIMNRSNNVVIVTWIHFFFSLKSAWPGERPLRTTAANENVFFFIRKSLKHSVVCFIEFWHKYYLMYRVSDLFLSYCIQMRLGLLIIWPQVYINKHCAHLSHPPFKKPLNSS